MYARLIVCKNFNGFALTQKDIAQCCIFERIVFCKICFHRLFSSCLSAFHQLVDVCAADSDWQKAYCGQYRETSSYIIRHYKGLIAFFCRQILKRSPCLIRSRINTLGSLCLSIFLFQHFLEYTESDCRFCCRTGLGNHIDGEIYVSDYVHKVLNIGRADGISNEINLRRLADALVHNIVKAVS